MGSHVPPTSTNLNQPHLINRHNPSSAKALEARCSELHREIAAQGALLAGDLGRLARESHALRSEVASASNLCKKARRFVVLEVCHAAQPFQGPRPSLYQNCPSQTKPTQPNQQSAGNQVDADLSTLEPRVLRLEASEATTPKAPLRLVAALEEKLEGAAAQQVGWCMLWGGLKGSG